MICPNCGTDNKAEHKFCVGCGTRLWVEEAVEATDSFVDPEDEKTMLMHDFENEETEVFYEDSAYKEESWDTFSSADDFEDEKTEIIYDTGTFEEEPTVVLEDLDDHNGNFAGDYIKDEEVPDFEYAKPVSENTEPEDEYTESEDEYTEPEDEYTEPEDEYTESEDEYTESEDEYTEPEEEYTEPEEEYTEPEDEYTEPEDEYTEPEEEYTEPEIEFSEPAARNIHDTAYIDHLRALKELCDEGVITEEEFTLKKRQILGI